MLVIYNNVCRYWPVVEQQEITTDYAAKSEEKKVPYNKVPSNPQIRKPPISLKPQWQTSVAHASLSQYKNELQRAVSYVLKQANSGKNTNQKFYVFT
jgi:hypothetical protein